LIARGEKTLIIQKRGITEYSGVPIYVLEGSDVCALINMEDPRHISLEEFRGLREQHKVSEADRKKRWPGAQTLYAYAFELIKSFDPALKAVDSAETSQTFVERVEIQPRKEVDMEKKEAASDLGGLIASALDDSSPALRELIKASATLPQCITWIPEFISVASPSEDSVSLRAKADREDDVLRLRVGFDSGFVKDLKELMAPLNRPLCLHGSPSGPNWTYLPIYDLALVRNSHLKDDGGWAHPIPDRIVWIPDFVCFTGSSVYAKDREPNDLDVIFRAQERPGGLVLDLSSPLTLKIRRVLGKHLDWNSDEAKAVEHEAVWDLCLVRHEALELRVVDEPDFAAILYKGLTPVLATTLQELETKQAVPVPATRWAELRKGSAFALIKASSEQSSELRERLADLEHDQWAHWTEYLLANLDEAHIAGWQRQIRTPYAELSEEEKNEDREWADKILAILQEFSSGTATRGVDTLDEVVEKAISPPSEGGTYRYVLQHHWRGKSCHTDLRCQFGDFLIGWTLLDQMGGKTKEPVETLAQAKTEDAKDIFKIDWGKGEIKQGEGRRAQIQAIPKGAKIPSDWLNVEGASERTEPGERPPAGATQKYPGVFHIMGRGAVEYGAWKPDFVELWLSDGKLRSGRWLLRKIERKDAEDDDLASGEKAEERPRTGSYWTLMQPEEDARWSPYVLSSRAISQGWLPPEGHSALPKSIRSRVPEELRYWTMDGKEALDARRELASRQKSGGANVKQALAERVNLQEWPGISERILRAKPFNEEKWPMGECKGFEKDCEDDAGIEILWADGRALVQLCRGCFAAWVDKEGEGHPDPLGFVRAYIKPDSGATTKDSECPKCGFKVGVFRPNLKCPECDTMLEYRKKTALQPLTESTIHMAFTVLADKLLALGYLTREERIALSNVIGDTLDEFGKQFRQKIENEELSNPDVSEEHILQMLANDMRILITQPASDTEGEATLAKEEDHDYNTWQRFRSKLSTRPAFFNVKGIDGEPDRWLSISSTAIMDKTGEIVARIGIDRGIERLAGQRNKGPLYFWHIPWLILGDCDFQAREGICLIESGTWRDDPISQAAKKTIDEQPGEWGISIGFKGEEPIERNVRDQETGRRINAVYWDIAFQERSVLPSWASCAYQTLITTKEAEIAMRAQQETALRKLVGDKMADGVLADAKNILDEAEEEGLVYKDSADADADAEEKSEEGLDEEKAAESAEDKDADGDGEDKDADAEDKDADGDGEDKDADAEDETKDETKPCDEDYEDKDKDSDSADAEKETEDLGAIELLGLAIKALHTMFDTEMGEVRSLLGEVLEKASSATETLPEGETKEADSDVDAGAIEEVKKQIEDLRAQVEKAIAPVRKSALPSEEEEQDDDGETQTKSITPLNELSTPDLRAFIREGAALVAERER
jgi:hypothetical protein